jgi:hypothetical protein
VEADSAPSPTLPVKKLKDFIRKEAKNKPISMAVVKEVQKEIEEIVR